MTTTTKTMVRVRVAVAGPRLPPDEDVVENGDAGDGGGGGAVGRRQTRVIDGRRRLGDSKRDGKDKERNGNGAGAIEISR